MQLKLISIVLILHCMEYTDCQQNPPRHRQHKQSWDCHGGCLTCSASNGCLSCKPRFFFFLERSGMRQVGVCVSSCPSGYYGTRSRSPDMNKCTKCGLSNCDSCFNKNFCMRCKEGYYLYHGKCHVTCPEGLVPSSMQRECVHDCTEGCEDCLNEDSCTRCKPGLYLLQGQCTQTCPGNFEPNEQLRECTPQVPCEVGEWSDWSPCSRRGKTCGFKRGEETRRRDILRPASPHADACPPTTETRKCVVKRKKCPGRRKGERRHRKNRKEKEGQDSQQEHTEAGEVEDHEELETRNKTEHRRRRGQSREAVLPTEGAVH
ncbi:R-spondin-3 [Brienomyrus brachyistius]|uniref:R-spondin-3 n=1 Tax=Brienomyrus brachyistius TaxID=42636 RepID=UPI0020B36209|nr:R-spondin-3 [Brienomyrus brachyistius]